TLSRAEVAGEVFAIGAPRAVDRGTNEDAQPGRGEAAGQPVDRHDAAGMQQRTSVVALEVGVVEHDRPASMLDSTAHDDPVAPGRPLEPIGRESIATSGADETVEVTGRPVSRTGREDRRGAAVPGTATRPRSDSGSTAGRRGPGPPGDRASGR